MKRAEAEVVRKLDPDPEHTRIAEPDIRIGDLGGGDVLIMPTWPPSARSTATSWSARCMAGASTWRPGDA